MNLLKKQLFQNLLYALALFGAINAYAMEEQAYQSENELASFIEILDQAQQNDNRELCKQMFDNFAHGLTEKEPIEQVSTIVEVTKIAAEKSEPLTLVFCSNLLRIYNANPDLSEVTQEITSGLIPTFRRYKRCEALEKLACIFADNTLSNEYQAIQRNIKDNLSGHKADTNDSDEQIARALEGTKDDDEENNEEIQRAIAASFMDHYNNTDFNAPSFNEIAALEEEDDLSRAIEHSLQVPHTQPSNTQPSAEKASWWDIILGGFGS